MLVTLKSRHAWGSDSRLQRETPRHKRADGPCIRPRLLTLTRGSLSAGLRGSDEVDFIQGVPLPVFNTMEDIIAPYK